MANLLVEQHYVQHIDVYELHSHQHEEHEAL